MQCSDIVESFGKNALFSKTGHFYIKLGQKLGINASHILLECFWNFIRLYSICQIWKCSPKCVLNFKILVIKLSFSKRPSPIFNITFDSVYWISTLDGSFAEECRTIHYISNLLTFGFRDHLQISLLMSSESTSIPPRNQMFV